MVNNEFEFEIITPLNRFFKEKVKSVIVNTPNGKFGIQSLHEPVILAVDEGKLEIKIGEKWLEFFVAKGFMEVQKDTVLIYTDEATDFSNRDKNKANKIEQIKYEGEQRKKNKIENTKMESFINRAINNLKNENGLKK